MKKAIITICIMLLLLTISVFAFTEFEETRKIATEFEETRKIAVAQKIAEQYILDNHKEKVRLTVSQMENSNNDGKICFLIEAEGESDSTHNLFVVAVKDKEAELIIQLF